jgi:hypothetical protein
MSDSATLPPLTVSETAKLASIFCIFWFAANWTVNASLGFTSVASTTILSSMSGKFYSIGFDAGIDHEYTTRLFYAFNWPCVPC